MGNRDKKKVYDTIKHGDMSSIVRAAEIFNSIDMDQAYRNFQMISTIDMSQFWINTDIISSMNMSPILNKFEMINLIDMSPILNKAEMMSLIDTSPVLNTAKMMSSMNMSSTFRAVEIMNSTDINPALRIADTLNSMNISPIITEIINSMDISPILWAADAMSSMDMSPILWTSNIANSMMTPLLRAAEIMNSRDITSLINSFKGIDTFYINSEFLSSEVLSSLKSRESDNEISIAIPAREPIDGCEPVENDFSIVPIEESDKIVEKPNKLETAIKELENLLESKCNDESKYQSLLKNNPVLFGHMYSEIKSHETFDDKNIPDFTGVRVIDDCNDIFEIKAPFINLFGKNGEPLIAFHKAWAQIERYSNFAEDHRNYLYEEKGLKFESPKIFLYIGYNLDENQRKEIRKRERNSSLNVNVYTYNDLLISAKNMLKVHRTLFEGEENS
ncbi:MULTISPECIES: Shedu anti-phage system protein SduA domain-containing protein [Methanobacterium]|uniref:DUF4263 domain-containing protein n=1 Tax=Methanobacterium veterum TaxID=408577 RepID=A0A9E5DQ00_9EURY|nr:MULTISPECIES: Shedu anti-phage system protein SduA domain-containing protein [Methanobacterium]MCZ3366619.1 DUF4263 domain-containing protein [Methanobacterium veterum]MCZ3374237.1 DUF4263 domain-containing protein [Methanobacterium veterum]